MDDISTLINQAVKLSGKAGYQNSYRSIGGGELNDTYILTFDSDKKLVLRVARYENQESLANEARALELLDSKHVPQLVFFDKKSRIDNRLWILEGYQSGTNIKRLNTTQFYSLGILLAAIHRVKSESVEINVWRYFIEACRTFGNEAKLLSHSDDRIQRLTVAAKIYFESEQPMFDNVTPVLIHGDATPGNILVDKTNVSLIDWELSYFSDPMAEFPTIYYDDMEYNKGKWRVHISSDERNALFKGYEEAGGVIDQERLKLWMIFDKLGAAVFLHWRIHESGRNISREQLSQYQLDLKNLLNSLEKSLVN
ncbi:MAG TPA: aminoglycoside phosphotransferase family protein [Candidatus Saccharimonadales bacterium]|nr:aminoglycoside phosphotransferase family protein [Candidatus Saccharimonadales bacterium]